MKYHVVWKGTGEPYPGTLRPTTDRQALLIAMTNIQENVSGLRDKLEIVPCYSGFPEQEKEKWVEGLKGQ